MATPFDPTIVFQVVDLGGVLANGVLGGVVARRLRFDPVGFVTLALISGLGGGVLRDTLLQGGVPVALTNPAYLVCGLIGALIAFLVDLRGRFTRRDRHRQGARRRPAMAVGDPARHHHGGRRRHDPRPRRA
jgi:uncharacterized membrane protein YeiH